jgi:2'-5' RNA ligase
MDFRRPAYYRARSVAGKSIRSFIAVDLQSPVLAAVGELQAHLARIKADVRWVRPQGMHVTLKFLGPVEPGRLEQVYTSVVAAVRGRPALQLCVHGLGAFPSWRRPRVLWVGLAASVGSAGPLPDGSLRPTMSDRRGGGDGLAALAAAIDTAVQPFGFEPEKRGFTPHITLGRVNSLRGWPALEEVLKMHLDDDFGSSTVSAVVIYRSTLRPDGSVYSPLWTIPLGQHKERPQS